MRYLLLTLMSLLFLGTMAQDLTADTMTYKGKLYYVYPYQFEWEKTYRGRYHQENTEIPPIFDSLPTGDYLMLHAFKPTFRNRWKNKHGKLKPIVGAEFRIEQGKLNGKATYYYYDGQKRKEGSFYNGLKDGEWIFIKTYYDYSKKKSVPYLAAIYTYNKGVEEGLQKELNENEKPTEEYIKKGDGFIDYYKVYYPNGQIHLELHADSVTQLNKNSLWPLNFAGQLLYDTAVHKIDFEKMTKEQHKKYMKKHRYTFSFSYTDFENDYYLSDYYQGYLVPTGIPFVVYHENGEVMARFSDFNPTDRFALNFDTIYNPLGRPAVIKVPLTDSVDHPRFRLDYYQADRVLKRQTYYVLDSTFEYKEYRRDKLIGDKMQTKSANYSYFYSNDWSGKRLDSLYLISISNKYDQIDSSYMSPKIPDKIFVNSLDSTSGHRRYFTILKHDSAMSKYKITVDFGRVSVDGFYHCDSARYPLEVLTIKDVLSRFTGYENNYHYSDEEEESYSKIRQREYLDSVHIYLDKKPYTGTIIVSQNKLKEPITINENEIICNYNRNLSFVSTSSYTPKFKLTVKVKNGQILSINDKGKKFESNYTFKNNMPHGKSTGYHKRRGKERLAFEINTNEGYYHGDAKLFAYRKKKMQKDDKKYFLIQSQRYSNGLLVDTHAVYYPNGTYEYVGVCNKKGEYHGDFVNYYRDGGISFYRHFKNDLLDSVLFEINELGDTVQKGFYVKGKEEGQQFKELYDYQNGVYVYRLWSNYHQGRLQGDLKLFDSYNTLRLELKIDSGYSNNGEYSYLNIETILNDWSSDLAFTGEVNVYHPNGKKYLNGKTKVTIDTLDQGNFSYGMQKVGTWTYNNTVERKIAELEFVKEAQLVFGADTLTGIANYKAFYPDGSTKYIGILQYEDTRLNCATDIQESDFVASYNIYINKEGDTLVQNGTGKLQLYNIDDNVNAEGQIINGKKNGWWKYYNDEGKLIEVGQYVNGEKHGRWLSGDLTGINYLDPQCFQSEQEKEKQQEREKFKISIHEEIYEDGERVSEQVYEFTRTK